MITLTLITIVRNDINGLKNTFDSIKNKPCWVKWVVIDGCSTDGTTEFLNQISNFIDFLLSEPDDGIADAFNKGILNSETDFVLFLNAGDLVMDGFFKSTKSLLNTLENLGGKIAVGRINFGGRIVGSSITSSMQKKRNYLPHQGMLIKRVLYNELGLYDTEYRLGMDYEWSLRLLDKWNSVMYFSDEVLVYMDNTGVSISNYPKTFFSYHTARMKHKITHPLVSFFFSIYFILKRALSLKINSFHKYIQKKL